MTRREQPDTDAADAASARPPAQSLVPPEQSGDVTAWLAAIVTSSNDAIISKTLDGLITTWNPAAEQLFGYTADEAIGQPITLIVPPERQGELAGIMEQLTRGEAIAHLGTVRVRKDGSRVQVSLSISPVRDTTGRIVGAAKVSRDMTQERRYIELEAEFSRAAELQAQLLPHAAPDLPGYEFAGVCLPARQVGGDFFDWLAGDDAIRLSLGDVMGKGMPASLLTATVRAALRVVEDLPVSAAVEAVNRALSKDLVQTNSFITLFHAALEPTTGELTYVDAGHGMVFIQRREGVVEPLRLHSLPLGVMPSATYPAGTTTLEPGDTLVIYSDGLPDARPELRLDPEGVAEQIGALPDAQAKLEHLVSLVSNIETRPDDLTLVVLRRREEGAVMRDAVIAELPRIAGGALGMEAIRDHLHQGQGQDQGQTPPPRP